MASRRSGRIFALIGVILLLAGLFAIWYGASPASAQNVAAIPPSSGGIDYFSEYDFSVLAGGHVEGTFSVLNGTPVSVFVYNDADYNAYVNGANLTGLYTATAVNGTISVDVPGFDTYHVIFQHGPGYNTTEQDVSVNLTSTGIDPSFFLGGLAALIFGGVFLFFGVRRLRAPETAPPSGVLPSRATYGGPPVPPAGPDTTPTGDGMYRVPPPLPGTGEPQPPTIPATTAPTTSADAGQPPMGTVVLTLENRSAADETVTVSVNGAPVSTTTVRAGTTVQASLPARLASPFGSMVSVDAVTSGGRRAQQSVFVGAHGTATMTLRIG